MTTKKIEQNLYFQLSISNTWLLFLFLHFFFHSSLLPAYLQYCLSSHLPLPKRPAQVVKFVPRIQEMPVSKSRPVHGLSRLMNFVIFLNPSRQTPGEKTTASSFQIISNSLFIYHSTPCSLRYTASLKMNYK
jgi:hypothetical protein